MRVTETWVQKESQKCQWSGAWSWIQFRWVPSQAACFPRVCPSPPIVVAGVLRCQPSAHKVGLAAGSGHPWGRSSIWDGELLTLLSSGTSGELWPPAGQQRIGGRPVSRASGRIPPTASPKTKCVATDRMAAGPSLGVTSA